MDPRENRADERHERRIPVVLDSGASFTVDVCGVGFCAESSRILQPGSEVHGWMMLNGERVTFTGRVVWARRGSSPSSPGRMGVRFTRVPWDLQRLLSAPDP